MENLNTITVPTNLFFALDNNLRIALVVLLSLSNRLSDKDGYFYRTNEDLQKDFKMGKNLTIAVLQSLYQYGLIEVVTKQRLTNYYRINVEKFKEYEQENLYNITKNKELHLNTVNYKAKGFKVTYNAGNSPLSQDQSASEETPSPTLENVSTALETSNPEILDSKTQDEIGEMWLEVQKENSKVEKAVILTPTNIEMRSLSHFDQLAKQRCIGLVERYESMIIPTSNESLEKCNKAASYIYNQFQKGLIDIEDRDRLTRRLIAARFKKHRV